MIIGSKVVYRSKVYTYMGESSLRNGMVYLHSITGAILVNKGLVSLYG